MKTSHYLLKGLLLSLLLCTGVVAQDMDAGKQTAKNVDAKQEQSSQAVPRRYLAGRDWLTPDLYQEVDEAIRSGKVAQASEKLKTAKRQEDTGEAIPKVKSASSGTKGLKSHTRVLTREEYEGKQRSAKRTLFGARVSEQNGASVSVGGNSSIEGEPVMKVEEIGMKKKRGRGIPAPGQYYMSQAFSLKVDKDGAGMLAYAQAAIEALEETLEEAKGAGDKEGQLDALVRMAEVQRQFLLDDKAAAENYRKAWAVDPENEGLKKFFGIKKTEVPVSDTPVEAEVEQ